MMSQYLTLFQLYSFSNITHLGQLKAFRHCLKKPISPYQEKIYLIRKTQLKPRSKGIHYAPNQQLIVLITDLQINKK